MQQWWQDLNRQAWLRHLIRAGDRFVRRGGSHLAAAISYFSVLSVVPLLMLAFSVLGLVITVIHPPLRADLESWLNQQTENFGTLGDVLYQVSTQALSNWAAIGLIGLGIAAWTGINWMGNLRRAGRTMMRPDEHDGLAERPWWKELLANLGSLLIFFTGIGLSGAASLVATSVGRLVLESLGLAGSGGWEALLRVLSLAVSLLVGVGLFTWLFHWFSPEALPPRLAWAGAVWGSAGLTILLAGSGLVLMALANNVSAAVFGPVIVLMIVLNLFASLILFIAAWLGTATSQLAAVAAAQLDDASVSDEANPAAAEPEPVVSMAVAQKSMGVGFVSGWAVGAASGVGLGAVVAAMAARWPRRRH